MFCWCGGGDSNPGTPTGQGPKPSALYGCSAPLTWLRPFTFKLKVWQPPHISWAGVRLSEPLSASSPHLTLRAHQPTSHSPNTVTEAAARQEQSWRGRWDLNPLRPIALRAGLECLCAVASSRTVSTILVCEPI